MPFIIWKNIVEPGRPQMTIGHMQVACWIRKATNTLRICNTYCFSTATMVAQRASMLYYLYTACLADVLLCTLFNVFCLSVGPTVYTVQVNVEYEATHYVGWKWEARMVERFVRYIVNGIPGKGVSEFHYHNKEGRPPSVAENDPFWFMKLNLKQDN